MSISCVAKSCRDSPRTAPDARARGARRQRESRRASRRAKRPRAARRGRRRAEHFVVSWRAAMSDAMWALTFDVDRARSWTSVVRTTARHDGARRARGVGREGEGEARREARGAASFARADNTHHVTTPRNASAVDDEGAARGSHAGERREDDGEGDVARDRGVWRRARCATWARRRGSR